MSDSLKKQFMTTRNTSSLISLSSSDVAWSQLRELPFFRSLVRAMEAHLFLQVVPLPGPLLDIGTGDGHFGHSALKTIDMGIDSDISMLRKAAQYGAYSMLCASNASTLPFRDASFSSVIFNSVLEHIPDLTTTLYEAFRVLQKGGILICTVPTDRLNENTGIARFLKLIGAYRLSSRYKTWFARAQKHFHLYAVDVWRKIIENAGFHIEWHVGYMSPRATAIFDLAHFYGGFNWIDYHITGKWVIFPWRPFFILEEKTISYFIKEHNPEDASCHFFVAKKA